MVISESVLRIICIALYIIVSLLWGLVTKYVGIKKNFGDTFFLGFFLHIFGLLFVLIPKKKTKEELINHYKSMLDNGFINDKEYNKFISKYNK